MRSDNFLWEKCVLPIYRQMYKEAEPSADFDKLIDEGVVGKHNWFMDYYLDTDRQEEIIDEHCKKRKLSKREREKIKFNILLGCSPNGYKEDEK